MDLHMNRTAVGNLLQKESSPYLRQHALDPVDWHPWNPEVLAKARQGGQPILLSIGYSACHWCHVMQRECFQDEDIARLMNGNFLCIKVDREERPDLDDIYQRAALIFSGQGGWPLTAFLTPQGEPFFVGTYFPPMDRYGRTGFPGILKALARGWQSQRSKVEEAAQSLTRAMVDWGPGQAIDLAIQPQDSAIDQKALDDAERYFFAQYDAKHGGFGSAPKFPCVGILQFLLQRSTKKENLLDVLTNTLDQMAQGGIYDQLGGGFHRYSTDDQWLVPHFEKMLYDNALLAEVYLAAYQITGTDDYGRVVREILDYLLRDMWHGDGAFFATQDADTHGIEGLFYTWSIQEIEEALGPEVGSIVSEYYGVTDWGNTEDGRSVLHISKSLSSLAEKSGLDEGALQRQLNMARQELLKKRKTRTQPFRDEKVITAWNGMAISALAKAGAVLGEPCYVDKAQQVAMFILENMWLPHGRLHRSIKDAEVSVAGFLEDYAYFVRGLLDLYSASLDPVWLERAVEIATHASELFWDEDSNTFYATEAMEELLFRPTSPEDGSFPSPVSVMTRNLLQLQNLMPDTMIPDQVAATLTKYLRDMEEHPWSFASLLAVLDLVEMGPMDVFVVGPRDDGEYQRLLRVLQTTYLPGSMIHGARAPNGNAHLDGEFWQGKSPIEGKPAVYICYGNTCQPPVTQAAELRSMLCHLHDRGIPAQGV